MRTTLLVAVLSLSFTALFATKARGQGKSEIAILMAMPAVLGVDWELSNRVALRPDVSFSETTQGAAQTSTTVGLSSVLYLARWDTLRLYASPRLSHAINRVTFSDGAETTTQSNLAGSLGSQVALVPRLSLFAEVGVYYAHVRSNGTSSHTSGSRGSVGALFFF